MSFGRNLSQDERDGWNAAKAGRPSPGPRATSGYKKGYKAFFSKVIKTVGKTESSPRMAAGKTTSTRRKSTRRYSPKGYSSNRSSSSRGRSRRSW